ncbi:hypothetical protein J437_LFUL004502 [Ladona fulva]|uniref:VASt domain-containing protein n=1 Tax=Ladona fulva TaxID=123851 RepID=A0A8K0K8R8_LADFU|nr:hypothetical protein J437_LFUL004502 [Ladona fulva]
MNSEVSSSATFIVEHENPESNQEPEVSLERRKSVENLLISSHEVIGSSISPSLAFSAMTLPSGVPTAIAQNSLQAHSSPNPGMHSLEPRSSSPSSSASPHSSPRPHHKRDSSRGGSVEPQVKEGNLNRVESANLFTTQGFDCSQQQENPSGRSSEASNPPSGSDGWLTFVRLNQEGSVLIGGGSGGAGGIIKKVAVAALVELVVILGIFHLPKKKRILRQNGQKKAAVKAAVVGKGVEVVSLRWKEVTSITKEKTALVIPNAIQICTESGERHFFTSFGARDKTYLMLFRVWQNALMEERMSMQEMWQWVHTCYGDELGLTSDDEEGYVAPPTTDDDKMSAISVKFSVDSLSEDYMNASDQQGMDDKEMKMSGSEERGIGEGEAEESQGQSVNDQDDGNISNIDGFCSISGGRSSQEGLLTGDGTKERSGASELTSQGNINRQSPSLLQPPVPEHLPSDMSDTTESDVEKNIRDGHDERSGKMYRCTSAHEGRQLVNIMLPIHVDQLFTLLFTTSKFYLDFHAERRTCDILQSSWQIDPETGQKVRQVSLTLSLGHSVGPKTAQVTEAMVMLPCSRPGYLYSIDVEAHNSGIPYADSFFCFTHFCLSRASSDTQLSNTNDSQSPTATTSSISGTPSPPPASSTPVPGSPQHITNHSTSPAHQSGRSSRHHHHLTAHQSASMLSIYTQIKYKKSVWGLVKSIIEKNSWSGLEEFYQSLVSALQLECEKMLSRGGLAVVRSGSPNLSIPGSGKRKARMRRRRHGMIGPGLSAGVGAVGSGIGSKVGSAEDDGLTSGGNIGTEGGLGLVGTGVLGQQHHLHHGGKRGIDELINGSGEGGSHHTPEVLSCVALLVLIFLLLLNALLYYKLWSLEEWTHQSNTHAFSMLDLHILRHPPKSHDEWLRLLQHQEALHHVELEKWQKILQAAIQLLRQV